LIAAVVRIVAFLAYVACVVAIAFTDLDITQRLLLSGIVIGTLVANWNGRP
jgi:hypothetical protein